LETVIPINLERMHLFGADINVCMMAEIDIKVQKTTIEQAVKALTKRHPLLTAGIFFDENNNAHYRLQRSRPISVDYYEEINGDEWKNWILHQNALLFDFENGPLLRIFAGVRDGKSTFALLGHHLLGDGLSFLYLLRDFLLALENNLPNEQITPRILTGAADFPRKAQMRGLTKVLVKSLNRAYRAKGKRYTTSDFTALHQRIHRTRQPNFCDFYLSKSETSALVKQCRQQDVTVNEAITAAFMSARQNAGNTSDYLGIACSVRNEVKNAPGESMGNFVSGISVSAEYNREISFWDNARRLQSLLSLRLKDSKQRMVALAFLDLLDKNLIDSMNFFPVEENITKPTKIVCGKLCGTPYDRGLGVSNLGKHEFVYNTFRVVNCLFIPPLFFQNDFIVSALTINSRLAICLRYIGAELTAEMVERQFQNAKELLFSES